MKTNFTDALDQALNRLQSGEAPSKILAANPELAEELAPFLETGASLTALRAVEMPSAQALATDRRDFLDEISALSPSPVSLGPAARLKKWMARYFFPQVQIPTLQLPKFKEQRQMSALLIKAMLVFGVIFGSAGGTAAMAAESLPDSPLYPVKLAMENARLSMADTPAAQAKLHLELAQTRAMEMEKLAQQGNTPDASVMTHLQQHLEQAFAHAAQTSDPTMTQLLVQAQAILEAQAQNLAQPAGHPNDPAHAALQQASQLLQQAGQEAAEGIEDPNVFRSHHSNMTSPGEQHSGQPNYGGAITGTQIISGAGTMTNTGIYSYQHQNRHNWQGRITDTQVISNANAHRQNRQAISHTLRFTGTETMTGTNVYSNQHRWRRGITGTHSLSHTTVMSNTRGDEACNTGNCNNDDCATGNCEPPNQGSKDNHNGDSNDNHNGDTGGNDDHNGNTGGNDDHNGDTGGNDGGGNTGGNDGGGNNGGHDGGGNNGGHDGGGNDGGNDDGGNNGGHDGGGNNGGNDGGGNNGGHDGGGH